MRDYTPSLPRDLEHAAVTLREATTGLRDRQQHVIQAHAALVDAVTALRTAQAYHRAAILEFESANLAAELAA